MGQSDERPLFGGPGPTGAQRRAAAGVRGQVPEVGGEQARGALPLLAASAGVECRDGHGDERAAAALGRGGRPRSAAMRVDDCYEEAAGLGRARRRWRVSRGATLANSPSTLPGHDAHLEVQLLMLARGEGRG